MSGIGYGGSLSRLKRAALALLRPFPGDALAVYAVDRRVNNPRHDDPACIVPLPAGADLAV